MKSLSKRKSHAFGKDVYLIGTIDGKCQWLEAPSWDCGWYWGFGYVEEYTRHEHPDRSKDIAAHSHISSIIVNTHSWEKFDGLVLTNKEQWQVAELFKQFYLLKDMAAFALRDRPGCPITTSPVDHGNLKALAKQINEEMIPRITAKVIEILSPINGE